MFSLKKDLISVRCDDILAAYRVNSCGLSSKSLLSLKFHWLALVNFSKYNQLTATILSIIFLFIVLIKKKFLKHIIDLYKKYSFKSFFYKSNFFIVKSQCLVFEHIYFYCLYDFYKIKSIIYTYT